jgi:hypothetical protein
MTRNWMTTSIRVTVVLWFLVAGLAGLAGLAGADGELERTPAPQGASVYLIAPEDGAVVSSPVLIRFGLAGAGVAPAGVANPKTGHHHLIIDTELPPLDRPIPNDAQHRHFGGGQTEVLLELEPGTHQLQLVLGDYLHIPHDPPLVSEPVTVTVE